MVGLLQLATTPPRTRARPQTCPTFFFVTCVVLDLRDRGRGHFEIIVVFEVKGMRAGFVAVAKLQQGDLKSCL